MSRKNKANGMQRIAHSVIALLLFASLLYADEKQPDQTPPQVPQGSSSSSLLSKLGTSTDEPGESAAAPQPGMPVSGEKEPIVVNGDVVEYFHDKKQVVGTGNVSITYKDVILTCERIIVYLDTREGIAEGNVKVRQNDAYFTGDKISYNFDTRKGEILNGYLSARPFFGRAASLDKAAVKDDFEVNQGYVTTCDLDEPHYRVQARQVKVYVEDKVVAKHILFYVGKVPVMYLPYYVQSLKDRKTHISVIPGEDKDWGYYVLTAYRYYLADWSRGDILLDYRSKKGLGEGINHYIDTQQLGKGAFKFYYTHENDSLAYEKTGAIRDRYRYQYRHRWDMGPDTGTYMIGELNKLSDRDIIKDIFYNEYEELGSAPDNYISFITTKPEYSTEFLVRARLNNFETVVERLPQYNINIYNYQIKNTAFYYTGSASGAYLNTKYDNSNVAPWQAQKDVGAIRVDAYNQLSYAAKLFKSWSVTPYFGMRETYYSRNKWGDTNEFRTIFQGGVDNQIKFYKIYDVETDFMGLDINKLRHIITPVANYYFRHQPTIDPSNLNQFDEIDAFEANNGILFGLENRLQTKRGESSNMKSVDLATLMIWSDYQFRLDKGNTRFKSNKFKTLEFQLELIPYSWAYLTSKLSVDTKRYTVQSGSVDLVMNGGDKWQLIVGQRYENVTTGITSLITMDATYKINDKWRIRAYERFNLEEGFIEEQEYTIYRDLHCWIAEFVWNIQNNGDQGVYLIMKLKAFPEYPVGYRRTISRPRFGAAGETY